MTAFRVFSGWDSRQAEAAEVFKFSLESNTQMSVNDGWDGVVHPIKLGERGKLDAQWTYDGHVSIHGFSRQGTTQFTYSRFLVPWLCGFEGRALFADGCDMLCLGDVAELAEFDLRGKALAVVKNTAPRQARPRVWTSLMLMDCSRLTMWTPERVQREPDDVLMRLRHLSDEHIGELPPDWNALIEPPETEPPGLAKIAHWSCLADPNGGSWIERSGSSLWMQWRDKWRESR